MSRTLKSLCIAAGASVALAASPAALAQEESYDEETLRSFVVAAISVQEIAVSAQQQLAAAETPQQQEEIQVQANDQMVAAIESEGLSVDEYNEVAQAASSNPEVASQIQGIAAEEAGAAPDSQ